MLISRTPFRISFVGGGTDLKVFYRQHPGAVLSTTINKYIYLSAHEYFYKGKSLLKYRQTEEVTDISFVKHPILREVFQMFGIHDVDFNSIADIPAGTGMGSSSAFTAGLIKLCAEWKKKPLSNQEIAELACKVEIDILGEPIGKQDQYACALGGMNLFVFNADETVTIRPLYLPLEHKCQLENNLHLFYTRQTRAASDILTEQRENTHSGKASLSSMKRMSEMAFELFDELSRGNLDAVGNYLHEGWERKKELASNISNSSIDELYETGLRNGASGGKLLGAGGGGFLLFYCAGENSAQLKEALSHLEYFPFKLEESGSVIIFKD